MDLAQAEQGILARSSMANMAASSSFGIFVKHAPHAQLVSRSAAQAGGK